MQQKRWQIREASDAVPWGGTMHPLVHRILLNRDISSPEEAARFLTPALGDMLDPYLMRGVQPAVERLLAARQCGEMICVYGDYDTDGITGTALLVSFLRAAGFTCTYFIPNRFDDGYGLQQGALERIIDTTGAGVVLSVDCGITAVKEAIFCRESGVDLIIVDHHTPVETIPDACAVIDPLQPGCDYPFKSLAGVGVAFNLVVAVRKALRDLGAFGADGGPDLREWLDLVALGTIADVVPLVGQNRILVHHGLKHLSRGSRLGIRALKQVSGIEGMVTCGHVGFRLAPRLNASGRMESAVPGVELLLGNDHSESSRIAEELESANGERRNVERRMFDEAVRMVEASCRYPACRSIVLASAEWHRGVVGIVASRLVERYHRPTVLIALDEEGHGHGSGRSIPGFHLLQALSGCADHLDRFGGHRYAAGIGVKGDLVGAFSEAFELEAFRLLGDEELLPTLLIDGEADPAEITMELVGQLKQLEPFGAGNPEPVLAMRNLTVVSRRTVGEGHLRLRLARAGSVFEAIGFGMADRETSFPVDIAFYPDLNEWNGKRTLQLKLKDLKPAETANAA